MEIVSVDILLKVRRYYITRSDEISLSVRKKITKIEDILICVRRDN